MPAVTPSTRAAAGTVLPKICGADFELGNFVTGLTCWGGTGAEASRLLLGEIGGVPGDTLAAEEENSDRGSPSNAQDHGRKFLLNGGCAYIDLCHLELCLPEVRSAFEHVAYTHALYRIAQTAAAAVNEHLPSSQHVIVLANNSDGHGHSYGSHLNVLVSRTTFEKICYRRQLQQGMLAAYQVSSIVFTGLGKVGAENGAEPAAYQLSQRADFIESLCSPDTTIARPIVNTRNEPLCGACWKRPVLPMGRMHVITYDHNLAPAAGLLKIGVLQLILAMLESGWADPRVLIEDPVLAMQRWSRDPLLEATARLWSGAAITAVDLQCRFLDEAERFVSAGLADEVVPDAATIVALWRDTLEKLRARDYESLGRRLDWVLKLSLLARAIETNPRLDWQAPAIKHLDQLYSSLDPADGLYWACERAGLVDRIVTEERICFAVAAPPSDTRASVRAHLLRLAAPGEVEHVDWDSLRFQLRGGRRVRRFAVELPDPLTGCASIAGSRLAQAASLPEAIAVLGGTELAPPDLPPTYLAMAPAAAEPVDGFRLATRTNQRSSDENP